MAYLPAYQHINMSPSLGGLVGSMEVKKSHTRDVCTFCTFSTASVPGLLTCLHLHVCSVPGGIINNPSSAFIHDPAIHVLAHHAADRICQSMVSLIDQP